MGLGWKELVGLGCGVGLVWNGWRCVYDRDRKGRKGREGGDPCCTCTIAVKIRTEGKGGEGWNATASFFPPALLGARQRRIFIATFIITMLSAYYYTMLGCARVLDGARERGGRARRNGTYGRTNVFFLSLAVCARASCLAAQYPTPQKKEKPKYCSDIYDARVLINRFCFWGDVCWAVWWLFGLRPPALVIAPPKPNARGTKTHARAQCLHVFYLLFILEV